MKRTETDIGSGVGMRTFAAGATLALATSLAPAAVILVDFGPSGSTTTATGWNNVTSTSSVSLANLLTSTGAASAVDLAIPSTNPFSGGSGATGTTSASAPFPANAASDFLYDFSSGPTVSGGQIILSDLDPTATYSFRFYASRMAASGSTRNTTYTAVGLNTGSATLEPSENITNVASVAGIVPSATNQITIDLYRASVASNSSGTVLIGVMEITSVVPEPAALSLMSLAAIPMLKRRRRSSQGV